VPKIKNQICKINPTALPMLHKRLIPDIVLWATWAGGHGHVAQRKLPAAKPHPASGATCPPVDRLPASKSYYYVDALCRRTFADEGCRADRGQVNGPKTSGKYEGLIQQLGWGILRVGAARSSSCSHLPPPGLISAR